MANNEFREKLRELFWKYEKKQLRKVDALVEAFQGEEETVIKHLYRRYRITYHGPVLGGAAPAAQITEDVPATDEAEATVEETVEEVAHEEAAVQEEAQAEESSEGEEDVVEEAEEEEREED